MEDADGASPDRSETLTDLVRLPDRAALARNAAERFVVASQRAITQRGRFAVALSGGSTPQDLYRLLATAEFASQVDWHGVHTFWGDERAVPPQDPASNYRMAAETLLSRVNVPRDNIHRILAELPSQEAAQAYADTLRSFFQTGVGTLPRFDLMLLGLGVNGHTASLFPHAAVLHNAVDWVAAEYIPEVKMDRITLTVPVINASENVLFLISGKEKAATVRAVLHGEYDPENLPAQLIRPQQGSLVWLLDRDAASKL